MPVPREPELRLDQWVSEVRVWRAGNDVPRQGGAGQLVVEDRAQRSRILRGDTTHAMRSDCTSTR